MPRRRIPINPLPRRLDRRRLGATPQTRNTGPGADGPARSRPSPSAACVRSNCGRLVVRIANREALAIDTHTAWADVAAELADIRERTVGHAEELRALELERCDHMVAGLWPLIERETRQPCQLRFGSVNAARGYSASTSPPAREPKSPAG